MPLPIPRVTLTAAILLASVLLHLGLLGLIVLADRRLPTTQANEAIEVELVAPPPPELPKEEPPQPEPQKPEAPQPEAQKAEPATPLAQPEPPAQSPPQEAPPPQPPAAATAPSQEPQDSPQMPEAKPVQPEVSGGFAGEGKTKLTPEEIAALRAQVQKCWTLPVGLPNAMKLEAVLRVSLARNGAITAGPELMKANASAGGPVLVGIAMKALRDCAPYRLPAAKYNEWRTLDLRFLATGLAGLGPARPLKG